MVEQNVKSALKIADDAIALESGRLVLHRRPTSCWPTRTSSGCSWEGCTSLPAAATRPELQRVRRAAGAGAFAGFGLVFGMPARSTASQARRPQSAASSRSSNSSGGASK